jgi:predicted DNA-binding transcriptional regulator AlpA
MSEFPKTGFVRLKQIIGDPKANPPIPALIPVSKTTWWDGVKSGRFPKPVKLSKRTTAWIVEEVWDLKGRLAEGRV